MSGFALYRLGLCGLEQAKKVQVFPVSSRGALLAKEAEQKGEGGFISPDASAGFSKLETYILQTLSVRLPGAANACNTLRSEKLWSLLSSCQGPERLKMKLETPVQVASLLVEKYALPYPLIALCLVYQLYT